MEQVRTAIAGQSSRLVLRLLTLLLHVVAVIEITLIGAITLNFAMDYAFPFLKALNEPELCGFLLSTGLQSMVRLTMYLILISIVRNISLGKPFAPKNILRLRALGCGFFLYAGYRVFALIIESYKGHGSSEIFTLWLNSDADIYLMVALGIFVLTEVFKHGLVLRQEQDLTV